MNIKQFLPFLEWLPNYRKGDLIADLMAGITVAVLLIPQGMAYALLAGLPPVYGLFAGVVPLLLYAFFGTSRQLSVGPVALVSLLVIAGLSDFATPNTAEYIQLAILTAFIAGIIQLLLGFFRLGFLVNFLSHPVLSGFTSAAAIIIALSQIGNLLGISVGRSNQLHIILTDLFPKLGQINLLTLGIGLVGMVIIFGLKKVHQAIPGALIAVVLGIIAVQFFHWDQQGVAVIGDVPALLPHFEIPRFDWATIKQLLPLSLTICLISFIESLAIARVMEAQHKNYRVIPNQELIALGLTKVVGAFFQSFPTTGSFSRSAINNEAGAKTGIASVVTALLVVITLLFLTKLFFFLPKAILAAIIMLSVIKLIDYQEAIRLWKTDRSDFLTLLTTFVITLIMGIQIGVITGVILSLALMIYENSQPHYAVLGQLPNTRKYRNLDRFPQAIQFEGLSIIRFDAQIYFGNAEYFRNTIEELVTKDLSIKAVILDMSSIHAIDSSGIHVFSDLVPFLHNREIKLYVTSAIGPVRDMMENTGLTTKIGQENTFMLVHDAVQKHQEGKN